MKDFTFCDWFEFIVSSILGVGMMLVFYFIICIFH